MADRDYNYTVEAQDLQPYEARKEHLDVVRLIYDFSCYLDVDETMVGVDRLTVSVVPTGMAPRSWRQDYPIADVLVYPPVDTHPLRSTTHDFTNGGKSIEIWVEKGTPEFTYVVSFVAVSSASQRHKQVDTLIFVEKLVNPLMLGAQEVDVSKDQVLVIGGSISLPPGFDGIVILQNSGNLSNITIIFPIVPTVGQTIEFIDALGKDGLYPVTFIGDSGAPMDGDGALTFISSFNYDCLRWVYTGAPGWHLMATRFNFLA